MNLNDQVFLIITFFICPTNAHNSYKIVKLLKSFKIIIAASTCFGLHNPSSGSSQPVLRQSYNVDIGYIYHCFSTARTLASIIPGRERFSWNLSF